jgi:hypothetical protein
MRKSDEIAHDLCLRSIGMNTNNASLYKALAGIQSSMLSIQRQMDMTVKNINTLLKNIQLELNFDASQPTQEAQQEIKNDPNTTRGSKKFIEQMREELEQEQIVPQELFDDTDFENEEE